LPRILGRDGYKGDIDRLRYERGFRDPLLESILRSLLVEMQLPTRYGALLADGMASTLAARLIHKFAGLNCDGSPAPSRGRGLDPRRLKRVREFIDANLERELRLDQLAQVACLSQYHFARAFKQATGHTVHQYLTTIRLERAKELLAANESSIADIAFQCSFSSQANFTKAFGASLGVSPGRYRRACAVTDGVCQISILDEHGHAQVADVKTGDPWFFPPGLPHSLMGVGPTGSEFLLGFDNGMASEFNTLLLTDVMAHIPPSVLAKNFGVPAEVFKDIPVDNLWIFQGTDPSPLAAAQRASQGGRAPPPNPYVYSFSEQAPDYQSTSGSIKIVDSTKFITSTTTAAALLTIKPGGVRELHWHPNADEWQYWIKGKGRITVFDTGPKAATADFRAGDIGYVKKSLGHYIEHTGDTDLVMLGLFKTDHYQEVSLSDWLTHSPPQMVMQTLNISAETLAKFPRNHPGVMPP
jgi:oxalate decarboxylase family bicupin protein